MVNLDVLPGGQVVLPRAVFVAYIEDGPELVKRQQAHRDLDADHLDAGLTLSVHPAGQAKAAKTLLVELALSEQQIRRFKSRMSRWTMGSSISLMKLSMMCCDCQCGATKKASGEEAFVESDAGIHVMTQLQTFP